MSFPPHDRYWTDTADFVKSHIKEWEELIALSEFCERFAEKIYSYSYPFSFPLDVNLCWAIIHKGRLHEISHDLLKYFKKEFKPVYANSVFVVYARRKELKPVHFFSRYMLSYRMRVLFRMNLQARLFSFSNFISKMVRIIKVDYERELCGKGIKSFYFLNAPLGNLMHAIRSTTKTVYIGNNTVLCRVLGRYMVYVDSNDVGIVPHLSLYGYWEMWLTRLVSLKVQSGWFCIDAGANHGYYSLIMADAVGSLGKVMCIEPHPRLSSLLSRSLELNGYINHTSVVQKAIADKSGEKVKLTMPRDAHSMNASICEIGGGKLVCEVETATLDELTRDWPRVDFVKIDVEGAEQRVWSGMQETIRKNKNIIIVMEINCDRYSDPGGFLESIQKVFSLRFIDYDAYIKDFSLEECLSEQPYNDWMLYLQR